jgi:DNA-binding transcriptional regulator YiaG
MCARSTRASPLGLLIDPKNRIQARNPSQGSPPRLDLERDRDLKIGATAVHMVRSTRGWLFSCPRGCGRLVLHIYLPAGRRAWLSALPRPRLCLPPRSRHAGGQPLAPVSIVQDACLPFGERSRTSGACLPLARIGRLPARWASTLNSSFRFASFRKTTGTYIFKINSQDVFRKDLRFSIISGIKSFMTPAQCRAARALLNWNQDELAAAAQVSAVTIRNFENEKSSPQRASLAMMRSAFESAGVEFIADSGVQLRKPQKPGKKRKGENE